MGTERIVHYECKVCGRRYDVPRTGEVYEEPVYCCDSAVTEVQEAPTALVTPEVRKKPAKKKAAKKAAKKKAAKKAKKKVVKKKAAKKKATKKKAAKKKTAKKKAKKKTSKRR